MIYVLEVILALNRPRSHVQHKTPNHLVRQGEGFEFAASQSILALFEVESNKVSFHADEDEVRFAGNGPFRSFYFELHHQVG